MAKETFENSLLSGAHKELSLLIGEWEGNTKTWFEPDQLADESPIQGKMKSILDGRFIMHEYRSSLSGKPFEGVAIYGFHLESGRFQCAWVDSFHMGTGIMFSEGEKTEANFSVSGHYGAEMGEPWGWRTDIKQIDENNLIITAYNITPQGEEAKAVETHYKRKQD